MTVQDLGDGADGRSWVDRWAHFCVTVVGGLSEAVLFNAVGVAEVPAGVTSAGRPPVVVRRVGSAWVLPETESTQGIRPEVLRRLSPSGRVLSYASTGSGRSIVAYAEAGSVVASFEPTGLDDATSVASRGVTAIGRRLGVDVADVLTGGANATAVALQLMAHGFGVALTDEVMRGSAATLRMLPILPEVPAEASLPVRSPADAELSAVLSAAPAHRLAAAVAVVAQRLASVAGLADNELVAAALRDRRHVGNDSELGLLLRTVMADGQLGPEPAVSSAQRGIRGRAAEALFTALVAAPQVAVVRLIAMDAGVAVYRTLLEELADIEVPVEVMRRESAKVAAGGRATMVMQPGMLPQRPSHPAAAGPPGSRAVAWGKLPPSTGVFDAPDDQDTLT